MQNKAITIIMIHRALQRRDDQDDYHEEPDRRMLPEEEHGKDGEEEESSSSSPPFSSLHSSPSVCLVEPLPITWSDSSKTSPKINLNEPKLDRLDRKWPTIMVDFHQKRHADGSPGTRLSARPSVCLFVCLCLLPGIKSHYAAHINRLTLSRLPNRTTTTITSATGRAENRETEMSLQ